MRSERPNDVQLSLPARAENVAVVRHVIGAFGDVTCLGPDRLDDVRLAVTEACTNVVLHAYDAPDGRMDIGVRPGAARLDVTVADSGRGLSSTSGAAGPGFGLPLIASLANELEIDGARGEGSRIAMSFTSARGPARTA
jgi:anti-sigma regulatory factor (Ser/Thr protein kinase)